MLLLTICASSIISYKYIMLIHNDAIQCKSLSDVSKYRFDNTCQFQSILNINVVNRLILCVHYI